MSIKIKTKKEVVDGIAGRRIMDIDRVLKKNELPSEYTGSEPSVWCSDDGTAIAANPSGIEIGQWYQEDRIQKVLGIVRASGKRLSEINERIRKLKADWQGEETFII